MHKCMIAEIHPPISPLWPPDIVHVHLWYFNFQTPLYPPEVSADLTMFMENTIDGSGKDLHNDLWIRDGFFDLLVRQDATSVDVEFVLHDYVFPENRHVLHTRLKPSTG